jgi:hypothetical protein
VAGALTWISRVQENEREKDDEFLGENAIK